MCSPSARASCKKAPTESDGSRLTVACAHCGGRKSASPAACSHISVVTPSPCSSARRRHHSESSGCWRDGAKTASAGRRSPAEVAADEDAEAPADALYHVRIRSINFSRTVDFVSLGERGLVEFVQLNALMEPQLIWYRPLLKSSHPWQ